MGVSGRSGEVQRVCKLSPVSAGLTGEGRSGDRVLFQLAHKVTHPVHAGFALRQLLGKFQTRWAIQTEMLRLFLQQTDEPHRVDVVLLGELNHAAFFVAFKLANAQLLRLLAQAREYVLENSAEPLTVLDLCQQLYVSRRTLQNAFHAILGIGPNAWLKRIRLNAVRRELISPWSERETVKEAAMQWGFWHLGQFATDYQQLFAEKPSMTLHHRLRQWV